MSQIYAKITIKGKGIKYRVFPGIDEDVFEPKDVIVQETVPYDPATNIEEGQWFTISDFSKSGYAIDLITGNYATPDFPTLKSPEFKQIEYIFTLSNGMIMFQKSGSSKRISKKGIIRVGDTFSYSDDYSVITISEIPDAIYDSENDCLLFRSLSAITGIFKEISNLFREATDEETSEFLKQDFISLGKDFTAECVKIPNRKRIALAKKTLESFKSKKDKETVFSYIFRYCPKLKAKDNTFCINSDEELTFLLYGIEQRFYTTPVGKEKRIANSVIKMQ